MRGFTLGFIISCLVYLTLTAILGIIFLVSSSSSYGLVVAIVHSFLLGFITMIIFGVNYHIIPIFSGKDFYSPGLAYLHLVMADLGITGLVLPLIFSGYPSDIPVIVKLSSVLFAVSILVFIYNMLRTFMSPPRTVPIYNPFGKGDKDADKMAIRFTGISIVYLLIGCPLGVMFLFLPHYIPYLRPVHAHINLIGFVSIMIFGVSYHMFPRFTGGPIYSVPIGKLQFYLANLGLIGMALSWWVFERESTVQHIGLLIFGAVEAVAAVLYIYNSWKTLNQRQV
jgi:cbb3-type cytochrome oxidase subunit 1